MALFAMSSCRLLTSRLCARAYSTKPDKFDIYTGLPIPANKQRLVPTDGCYPKGFRAGSVYAGIKLADSRQPDLVLVTSDRPASGAAVFTKNELCAASITVSRRVLAQTQGRSMRGVVANSGCANTLTGQDGLDDAVAMSREAAKSVSGEESSMMVMHTGRGAQRLPIDNVMRHLPKLSQAVGSTHDHWMQAAIGLCTTDTYPKLLSRTFSLPSAPAIAFSFAGLTKGAGMVHPNMATTLGIICTDAPVTPKALQILLRTAANRSYNCISIDGDTSTNDMVAMFANGAAASTGQAEVDLSPAADGPSADYRAFQHELNKFMAEMAQLVVRDAEGASKFITIRIRGSPSDGAAKMMARAVARSVLIKTGFYGQDPGWHGILAALGYALLDTPFAGQGIFVPEQTSVSFMDGEDTVKFFERGVPMSVNEASVKSIMEREDLEVVVELRDSAAMHNVADEVEEAVYWTCDMTHDFISLNSGVTRASVLGVETE